MRSHIVYGAMVEHMEKKTFLGGLIMGVLLTVTTLQSITLISNPTATTPPGSSSAGPNAAPAATSTSQALVQISDVIPARYDLGISFGDVVVKMVQSGAIDKDKFVQLYAGRQALSKEQQQLLDPPSNQPIVVDQNNAGLLLNLLWPLGIANKSMVLSQGPAGTQYKDEIGNLASTGGWTLGKIDGGKLFNSLPLVTLTPQQEAIVKDIAQHIYRPCCQNHTAFPDCNHGAAMLGFIELAVSQGLTADQIYHKALVLNSYWFPQNYMEIATYFKVRKNLAWKNVDAKEALGVTYSSGQGFAAVDTALQADGLLPKANGGGSCGA
jgi:hypothetical protein